MGVPRACWVAGIAASGCLAASACLAQVQDVELKAAFIYNFALFTKWPDGVRAREPFHVCAGSASTLWPSLQALNGKSVNGRPWAAVDTSRPGAVCDLLVLSGSERLPAEATGILVVRDGPGQGATITLLGDDEQVRFDINTREAARHGLKLSSRLLRLARNVE